jgi:heme ABC exporter ATP-binding subunit CcmA
MLSPKAAGDIRLEHVTRRFGATQVLDDLTLHLPSGTITQVTGDNGAGKTSLLRIIAGTLSPASGRVTVSDRGVNEGMAALVPAGDRALYWRLTVRQELEFFASICGTDQAEVSSIASSAAQALHIEDLRDRQIGTLSTGQRRRVMVARGLVSLAPVLLLDEPYADLDETGCSIVADVSRAWIGQGGAVLWTSPIADGGPAPDRKLHLAGGRLTDG